MDKGKREITAPFPQPNLHYTAYVRRSNEPLERSALSRHRNVNSPSEEGSPTGKCSSMGIGIVLADSERVAGNRGFLTIRLDRIIHDNSSRGRHTELHGVVLQPRLFAIAHLSQRGTEAPFMLSVDRNLYDIISRTAWERRTSTGVERPYIFEQVLLCLKVGHALGTGSVPYPRETVMRAL